MTRLHSSYLLRCWQRDGELERIEVEHVQSGAQLLAGSIDEAVGWICTQAGAAPLQAASAGRAPPASGADPSPGTQPVRQEGGSQ